MAIGQLFVALNFAELSSHFPIAGSAFQWTKYLSNRTYAWFTGWIYLFAGVITVAAVVATLPIAMLPMLNNIFGWNLNTTLGSTDQLVVALITLVLITILNIYGVKLVSIINNTGVVFEILGPVVFAFIMAIVRNNQGIGVIFDSGDSTLTASNFLIGMFMSLFVIYGFDTAGTLAEETRNPKEGSSRSAGRCGTWSTASGHARTTPRCDRLPRAPRRTPGGSPRRDRTRPCGSPPRSGTPGTSRRSTGICGSAGPIARPRRARRPDRGRARGCSLPQRTE